MSVARITFEITSRCNLACKHCMRDRSIGVDLEYDLIERVLLEIKPYGIDKVGFTGGEPLIHPRFKDVMETAVKMGYQVSFVTNGQRLAEFADFLAQPRIKDATERICISLDGADQATNDQIRGKGSFIKAMKGLLAVSSRGLPFVIKFTINSLNYPQLEEMVLAAGKLGAAQIHLSHLHPTPENMQAGLVMAPERWQSVQEEVERLKGVVKIPIYFSSENRTDEAIPICTQLAMVDYYIDSRGWLCLCCVLPGIAGPGAGRREKDRVADLHRTGFIAANKKLVSLIAKLRLATLKRLESGRLGELEHFQCMHCALQMDKLDWLERFPKSSWAKMLRESKGGVR
jgi:MoaA/NifB/PqqE/SkfB family radical SAM enzyme